MIGFKIDNQKNKVNINQKNKIKKINTLLNLVKIYQLKKKISLTFKEIINFPLKFLNNNKKKLKIHYLNNSILKSKTINYKYQIIFQYYLYLQNDIEKDF